jgi:hypothetical protein
MHALLLADIGSEIVSAFGKAIAVLFSFVPVLLGALLILLIGWIIATVVKNILVRVLRAVHFDQAMDHAGVGTILQRGGVRVDAAEVLARVVFWFIFLIFVLAAANALNVPAITNILNAIVLWLPQLFVALLVVIIGMLLARVVGDIVRDAMEGTGMAGARMLSGIVRVAIIAFAAIIALNQMGIGSAIVQELFAAVVFGLALALALAFGLGGRDSAKRMVDSWYASLSTAQDRRAMQQTTSQTRGQTTDGAQQKPASSGFVREAPQEAAPTA